MILVCEAPATLAASMKGLCFRERVWALITLETPGHRNNAMIKTMVQMVSWPNSAASISTTSMVGMTMIMSASRIRSVSTNLPIYPATIPMAVPRTILINAAETPTRNATLVPARSWLRRSRPMKSVPSQCLRLGPVDLVISGSTPVMGWYMGSIRGGIKLQMAIKANMTSRLRPILPRRFCL